MGAGRVSFEEDVGTVSKCSGCRRRGGEMMWLHSSDEDRREGENGTLSMGRVGGGTGYL